MVNRQVDQIYIFFSIITLIISLFFIVNFNRGLELTDESYILSYSIFHDDVIGRLTNFGLIGSALLELSGYNFLIFRIFGFFILFFCIYFCCSGLNFFLKKNNHLYFESIFLRLFITSIGTLCYYRNWVVTPSYNSYNLSGALLFISGLFYLPKNNLSLTKILSYFLIPFGLMVSLISKPSTAIFLVIVYFFWVLFFDKRYFFKNLLIISSIGSFYFIFYIYFFFESFEYYFKDLFLGYELIKTFDPRYSIFELFIFSIKYLIKKIVDYWFLFIFQSLLYLFFRKKNFSSIILFSFSLFILIFFNNLNLFLFSSILNFIFFCNKLRLNTNLIIIILPITIFFISFGTNTNIERHIQTSAILYFIIIFYVINNCKIGYKFKNFFFISALFFHLIINIYNNFFKPLRYDDNVLNMNYPIKIEKLNGNIYVDEFTKNYFEEVQKIKSKLKDDDNIKYLIDYTGRRPSLNLLFGLEFISRPWWTAGYIGSNDYIKKILKISDKEKILQSIIIVESDEEKRMLDLNNFKEIDINFNNMYRKMGLIKVKSNKSDRFFNLTVWKPK
jgi:hypothetical protein